MVLGSLGSTNLQGSIMAFGKASKSVANQLQGISFVIIPVDALAPTSPRLMPLSHRHIGCEG